MEVVIEWSPNGVVLKKLLNHLLNICAKFDIAARCVGDGIGFGKATKVGKLGLAIS